MVKLNLKLMIDLQILKTYLQKLSKKAIQSYSLIHYITQIVYKYILIGLGFIIVTWILWSRFIRIRIPKDIPFELTELRFYILLYICGIYLYILISIIKPREQNPLITRFVDILFTPLTLLDSSIKNNVYIKPYYDDFLEHIIPILNDIRFHERIFFVILIQIIPRIVFVSILLVDAFWVGKLEIVYYFIWLPIFPLIYRYLKYSIKSAKEEYITYLESIYSEITLSRIENFLEDSEMAEYAQTRYSYDQPYPDSPYHRNRVSIKRYLEIHLEVLYDNIQNDTNIQYEVYPFSHQNIYEEYRKKYNKTKEEVLTENDYITINKIFYDIQPKLLILVEFLEIQKVIPEIWYIRLLKVVIYTGYLTCWSYVLYKSFYTLDDFTTTIFILKIIEIYAQIEEPFSGIICY